MTSIVAFGRSGDIERARTQAGQQAQAQQLVRLRRGPASA